MASNEQKALQLLAEAEKKISSKGFFRFLFGARSQTEDAIECYLRAANLFKMAKNWQQAGEAFCQASKLYARQGTRHDAATGYVDAASCYKKFDINQAVNCLLKAIEIYTDMGRFGTAAKQHQTIAEIYETATLDLDLAIQHYEQAADYYRGEENHSLGNKCVLKVAQYAAQTNDFEKAIDIFQQLASHALDNALLKYSASEYMFKAALCHLCVDVLNAQHALERYVQICPAFQDSRECKLLKTLIEYIEEQNIDGYTDAVRAYDSVSRLDHWYTTILLRIKKQFNENPDLR